MFNEKENLNLKRKYSFRSLKQKKIRINLAKRKTVKPLEKKIQPSKVFEGKCFLKINLLKFLLYF